MLLTFFCVISFLLSFIGTLQYLKIRVMSKLIFKMTVSKQCKQFYEVVRSIHNGSL